MVAPDENRIGKDRLDQFSRGKESGADRACEKFAGSVFRKRNFEKFDLLEVVMLLLQRT